MSKHFLHSVLTVLVLTIAASNVILATSMGELQANVPALAAQLDNVSMQLHAAILAKQTTPTITSLSPTFGPIGTLVTITGTGFLPNNTVKFDFGSIFNVPSKKNGKTLTFMIPAKINDDCSTSTPCPTDTWQNVVPRAYSVAVQNAAGASNAKPFLVIDASPENAGKIVRINSLAPSKGKVGITVKITGKSFTKDSNTVVFGYHRIENIPSKDLKTLQFTVPSQLVYPCLPNQPCPTSTLNPTVPGNYPVRVFNTKGVSNTLVFTVK